MSQFGKKKSPCGVNTKKRALFKIILAIYRFYHGDKVDDFYLDRSEGFNEENKRLKGFNVKNQLDPESVTLKNKRPLENTIQDYEEENIELDMLPEKNIFEN